MNPKLKLFGIGGLIVTVIVIAAISLNLPDNNISPELPSFFKGLPPSFKESEAIHLVQNYVGKDGSGYTVIQSIMYAYDVEDIVLNSPISSGNWESKQTFNSTPNVYDVLFRFQTDDGEKKFYFIADLDSKQVYAGNEIASNILQFMD